MLCRATLLTRRERRHELLNRDERLKISPKTGKVPVEIGSKKQWVLNGMFNKRLRAVLPEQQKS